MNQPFIHNSDTMNISFKDLMVSLTSSENTSKPYNFTILTEMVLIVQEIISCIFAFGRA